MTQGMIPLSTSPDIKVMQAIDRWSKSDNTWKREGQTRLVSLVAGAPIAMAGAAYNAVVILIKLPVTTFRVLTGWIPTKEGHFRDDMPEDTSVAYIIWHAYKVVMCTVDIVLFPTLGLIHPKVNNWVHVKLCVSFVIEEESLKQPKQGQPKPLPDHKIPKPPPLPPRTIDKKKIEDKKNAAGTCLVDGKPIRLWDLKADAINNRRNAMTGSSSDSEDKDSLPLGEDDLPDVTDRVWGFDLDPNDLVKQRQKLRKQTEWKLLPIDKKKMEEDKCRAEQQAILDKFTDFVRARAPNDNDPADDNNADDGWDD